MYYLIKKNIPSYNTCILNLFIFFLSFTCSSHYPLHKGVVVVVIVWYITLCDKVCQWLVTGRWFSAGTPVASTNKTDRHDITKILLKVALNTITPTLFYINIFFNLQIWHDNLVTVSFKIVTSKELWNIAG